MGCGMSYLQSATERFCRIGLHLRLNHLFANLLVVLLPKPNDGLLPPVDLLLPPANLLLPPDNLLPPAKLVRLLRPRKPSDQVA